MVELEEEAIGHFSSLGLSLLTYKQRALDSMISSGPFRADRSMIDMLNERRDPL